jgi:Domain of unknown function (DUF4389)
MEHAARPGACEGGGVTTASPEEVLRMSSPTSHPLHLEARLDRPLSRWRWLVKWLLALPHALVLAALWVAFCFTWLAALVAILVTARYPRALFDFHVGVMRWSWRVEAYAFNALSTDRYPPFTLEDVPDYPARLQVAYPGSLSRGLALIKWWLLVIPQALVSSVLTVGLLPVLSLVAGLMLLFTAEYPRSLFDLIVGLERWVHRVTAYVALMTDEYPPFRLEMGETGEAAERIGPAGAAPTT